MSRKRRKVFSFVFSCKVYFLGIGILLSIIAACMYTPTVSNVPILDTVICSIEDGQVCIVLIKKFEAKYNYYTLVEAISMLNIHTKLYLHKQRYVTIGGPLFS